MSLGPLTPPPPRHSDVVRHEGQKGRRPARLPRNPGPQPQPKGSQGKKMWLQPLDPAGLSFQDVGSDSGASQSSGNVGHTRPSGKVSER